MGSVIFYSLLIFVLSYLCGTLPSGFLIGKLNGIDIRHYGSHNIGATNVRRTLGRDWSIACFLLDFFKGYLPVVWIGSSIGASTVVGMGWGTIIAAIAAVIGHIFPVWLKFKGGKGVATSLGVVAGIAFLPVIVGALCWVLIFEAKRIVSLASMGAVIVIAASAFIFKILGWSSVSWQGVGVFLLIAVLVIVRHKDNILRIKNGTENAFERKKKIE